MLKTSKNTQKTEIYQFLVSNEIWMFGATNPYLSKLYKQNYEKTITRLKKNDQMYIRKVELTEQLAYFLYGNGELWGVGKNSHFQISGTMQDHFEKLTKVHPEGVGRDNKLKLM